MPTRSNEQLCRLAQKGDTAARDILLEKNLGFIRKIALEQYRNMGLDENDIGIDLDDLMQEGSIGLLNAIPLFDAGRGMKFLTYAAPAIRNAMTDCIRAALAQFEQRMVDKKDGPSFQRVYLDDVLSEDERMLRIEAIADPHTQTPEQIYIKKRTADRIVCGAGQADCQRADLSAVPLWFYRWHRTPADRRGAPFPSQREPDKEGGGRGDGQPARKAAVVVLIRWEAAADGGFDIPLFRK